MTFRNKNHEIAEFIFETMRQYGFKPYNIQYGNTYFIFTGHDDSVVHFRVKGVWKHWKFGMWIHSEYLDESSANEPQEEWKKVVSIFAQYDTQIDKFKPSRSDLLVEYDAEDWQYIMKGNAMYELESMLKMMRRHPFMCYCGFCGERAGYYNGSFIWSFIKSESYDIQQKIKKALAVCVWYPYTKLKCAIAKRSKCISNLQLYNFEKENPGWSTDYLYGVRVTFTADATSDEEVAWLNRWFKRDKYGKYSTFDYAVELKPLRKDGMDEEFTYPIKKK